MIGQFFFQFSDYGCDAQNFRKKRSIDDDGITAIHFSVGPHPRLNVHYLNVIDPVATLARLTSRFVRLRSSTHTTAGLLVQSIAFSINQKVAGLPSTKCNWLNTNTITTSAIGDPAVRWEEDVNSQHG